MRLSISLLRTEICAFRLERSLCHLWPLKKRFFDWYSLRGAEGEYCEWWLEVQWIVGPWSTSGTAEESSCWGGVEFPELHFGTGGRRCNNPAAWARFMSCACWRRESRGLSHRREWGLKRGSNGFANDTDEGREGRLGDRLSWFQRKRWTARLALAIRAESGEDMVQVWPCDSFCIQLEVTISSETGNLDEQHNEIVVNHYKAQSAKQQLKCDFTNV